MRYRRAAKALMKLNPDYLRTYTPEAIDGMEWENLETAISLWIQHFEHAVRSVLVSEKTLCSQVLGSISIITDDGISVWPECFTKIADKIMAVFFRFGEGVARSNKEPQKLFKLLDMYDSLEKLKPEFFVIFEGESGADICSRFRELEKLLVHASTKVFWEFGLRIEGSQDGLPPPQDGSVPKLVRYATNYLKFLSSGIYSAPMAQVLRIEQSWKAGILSIPETEDDQNNLLKDAITNVMEAIQRNVESKKGRYYKDKALSNIFVMNTYWYIYMRSRNSELGKILGDQYMKNKYKLVAEESAYLYQKQTWGNLIKQLQEEEEEKEGILNRVNKDAIGAIARGKMEAFMKSFDEIMQKHRNCYRIPDPDLRDQIREAAVRFVVPAYAEFLKSYSSFLPAKTYLSSKTVEGLLNQIFEGSPQKNGDRRSISGARENSREGKPLRRTISTPVDA